MAKDEVCEREREKKTVRRLQCKTMMKEGKRRRLRSKGAHERAKKKGGMKVGEEEESIGRKVDLCSISVSTFVGITTMIPVSFPIPVATMISIPIPISVSISVSIVISVTARTVVISIAMRTIRTIRVSAIITIAISVAISSTIPVSISVAMIERITTTAIQILFIEKGLISFPVSDAIGLTLDVDRRRIIVVLVVELVETITNHLVADVHFASKVICKTFVAVCDAEEKTANIARDELLLLIVTRLTSQLTDQSQRIVRLEKRDV